MQNENNKDNVINPVCIIITVCGCMVGIYCSAQELIFLLLAVKTQKPLSACISDSSCIEAHVGLLCAAFIK